MRRSSGCLCVRFIKHSGCGVPGSEAAPLVCAPEPPLPPTTLTAAPLAPPTSLVNVTRAAAPPPADSRASELRHLKEESAAGFGRLPPRRRDLPAARR